MSNCTNTLHNYNTRYKNKSLNLIINDTNSLINNWSTVQKIILLQISDKFKRSEILNFKMSVDNIKNIYYYNEIGMKINLNNKSYYNNLTFTLDIIIGIENICEFKNIQYIL